MAEGTGDVEIQSSFVDRFRNLLQRNKKVEKTNKLPITIPPYLCSSFSLWIDNIGRLSKLTLVDNKNKEVAISGRVVAVTKEESHGGLKSLSIYDEKKDEIINVFPGKTPIKSAEVIPDLTWQCFTPEELYTQEAQNKVDSQTGRYLLEKEKHDIDSRLEKGENLFVIIAGKNRFSNEEFIISGNLEKIDVTPGYLVYEVTNDKGDKILLDLEFLSEGSLISYTNASEITKQISINKKIDNLSLIDTNFEERQNLISNLLEDKNIFSNNKLYEYYSKHLDEATQLLKKWYGPDAQNLLESTNRELGLDFTPLLIDPGIANRLAEFIKFVQPNLDLRFKSLMEIRQAFSKYLGETTVFRGMALIPEELDSIKKRGILGSIMLHEEAAKQQFTRVLCPYKKHTKGRVPDSWMDEIHVKRDGQGFRFPGICFVGNSPVISVSAHPELASSIGFYDSHRTEEDDTDFFLFTINLPEISYINPTGLFFDAIKDAPEEMRVVVGDFNIAYNNPEVESFVFYNINPENIQRIDKITKSPPKWEITYED